VQEWVIDVDVFSVRTRLRNFVLRVIENELKKESVHRHEDIEGLGQQQARSDAEIAELRRQLAGAHEEIVNLSKHSSEERAKSNQRIDRLELVLTEHPDIESTCVYRKPHPH